MIGKVSCKQEKVILLYKLLYTEIHYLDGSNRKDKLKKLSEIM